MNSLSVEEKLKIDIEISVNLLNTTRYEEVIKKTVPLIKKFPQTYILNNLLALAYNGLGKYDFAKETLDSAIKLNPNNIFVLNNLGLVHGNLENNKIAEGYLNRALDIMPSFLDASITLANLKSRINQNEDAIKILEKMEKLYKKSYILNFTLGNCYQQNGDFEKALVCFKSCLEIDPKNTGADKAISIMTSYKVGDSHLKEMLTKFDKVESDDYRILLGFALGKACEDIKSYNDSFKYLSIANEIKDQKAKYSIVEDEELFKNIKKIFNIKDIPEIKLPDKKIIFVLGMPRSGTSLIEQILSSHKEVYGAGELSHVNNFIEKNFMKSEFDFSENKMNNFKTEDFIKFQKYYMDKIQTDKEIIIDKAPLNFKWIGFLLTAFPNCKIIHSNRNAMDVCWSNYKNFFTSPRLNFCYNLINLGKFYLLYKDLMGFWNNLFKNKIYNIDYEDLINDQKKQTEDLLNYCGLDWDENCMAFYKNKKTVVTASLAQVRSPIYKSSIEKWKNYSKELNGLLNILKP